MVNKLSDDKAYILNEWWPENEDCWIMPYIEEHFREVSWQHQYSLMQNFLIFTRAVIEDYKLTDEEKKQELIRSLNYGKSKIVIIVGARNSGKTATAMWIAENIKQQGGYDKIHYVGEPDNSEIYPKWMVFVPSIHKLPDNAFALVDEAAIRYNARAFATKENMDLTKEMVVLRHKGISMVLITQNLELIELNVRRLPDMIIYKMSAEYGIKKKRGEIISKMERERIMIRNRLKPRTKSEVMVEYLTGSMASFRKFEHELPSFWDDEKISKSFKSFRIKEKAPSPTLGLADLSPY